MGAWTQSRYRAYREANGDDAMPARRYGVLTEPRPAMISSRSLTSRMLTELERDRPQVLVWPSDAGPRTDRAPSSSTRKKDFGRTVLTKRPRGQNVFLTPPSPSDPAPMWVVLAKQSSARPRLRRRRRRSGSGWVLLGMLLTFALAVYVDPHARARASVVAEYVRQHAALAFASLADELAR